MAAKKKKDSFAESIRTLVLGEDDPQPHPQLRMLLTSVLVVYMSMMILVTTLIVAR
tara:strand:+ start:166 stop:333 length:168 start_codon:yes stop_codon:yes gene_type:complete